MFRENKIDLVFIVDDILRRHGHTALPLPQYHGNFDAIGLIGVGGVKGYIARKNLSFKFTGVKFLIEEAFNQISNDERLNCCTHVECIEGIC